jgi:putative Mg2+ transporter-C (MgtC) family protein
VLIAAQFTSQIDPIAGLGDVAMRLVSATLMGAALGTNRELHEKPAGLRTHALVSLGSAVVSVGALQLATVGGVTDPNVAGRVIQGILAGVGFIGGGTILRDVSERSVQGLTTAASIWMAAALGIVCGSGYWMTAGVALAIALVVLAGGSWLEIRLRRLFSRPPRDPPSPHH